MVIADLYFSCTELRRSQKKRVDAIIEARVKDSELYTRSNSPADILNIMAARVGVVLRKQRAPIGSEPREIICALPHLSRVKEHRTLPRCTRRNLVEG